MTGLRQLLKMVSQNVLLPAVYRLYAPGKVKDGSVLFADAHHDERPENMEALYQAMKETGEYQITELYLDYQRSSFGKVLRAMLKFVRLYAGTQTVVLCDNFLPAASCRCKKETLVVQLWHACGAFKKFGYDTPDDIPPSYHGHVFRNTRMVTVSSPACVQPFASAMRLPQKAVVSTGICRTDRLFDPAWREEMRARLFSVCPQAQSKKVVLLAPTFRGSARDPLLGAPDPRKLAGMLGDDYQIFLCPHPHMKKISGDVQPFLAPFGAEMLYPAADVLVTDYSSLLFEYLLMDRPLILYVPDLEEYRRKRGFYLDIQEIPAHMVYQETDLAQCIRDACEGNAAFYAPSDAAGYERKRKIFLEKYMSSCDGHSTQRVLERIGRHRAGAARKDGK